MIEKDAAEVIKKFEGFIPKAKWDVNAYRIGYGSDTITFPDGKVKRVEKSDVITRNDADRDMIRRIKYQFIPGVIRQIGKDAWDKLSHGAKIALTSLSYNYGSITKKSIINAAKSGNEKLLADTIIIATSNDNKSLPESVQKALKNRRKAESDLILMYQKKNDIITGIGNAIPSNFFFLIVLGILIFTYGKPSR